MEDKNKMDGVDKMISILIICFCAVTIAITGFGCLNNYIDTLKQNENLEQRVKVLEEILNEEHI